MKSNHKNITPTRLGMACATAFSALIAAPLIAEEEPVFQLEEVIVTAQKREESLQDVPVAVTAISSKAFNDGIINDVESLAYKVPTMNFRKGNNARQSALILRGVGTISFSLANETSVSTVVDGVVLNQSGQAFSSLYDIERVEVLRGPQGTLFGKNASSGVVNIVTKGPTDEPEAYVQTSLFQDNEYKVKASVSGPLSDNVNGRLTGYFGKFDGLFENKFNNKTVNGYENWGVRGQLEYDSHDDLTIRLTADYTNTVSDCCFRVIGGSPRNAAVDYVLSDLYGVDMDGTATRELAQDFPASQDQRNWGLAVNADWDIGEHTLTSITAFRRWEVDQLFDQDMIPTNDFVGLREFHNTGVSQFDQWSQELRIASPVGESLEYVVGAFFWAAENERDFSRAASTCTASSLPEIAPGVIPCDESSTYRTGFARGVGSAQIDNRSLFGQATYHVTEQIRIIAGARYSHDKVSYHFDRTGINPGVPGIPANTPYSDSSSLKNDDFSLKTGLQYDLNEDSMLYVTYAQGYKGPGFNVSFGMNPGFEGPIAPETSDSYEIGLKSNLFDNRLILNLAAFYAEYEDFQSNSFIEVAGAQTVALTNAGTIETKGLEADFQARLSENLSISGGFAYTDATVGQFKVNHITGLPSAPNGSVLPFAPEVKFSVGADYTFPTQDLPFDIKFNTHYTYTDEQYGFLGENEHQQLPAHELLKASLVFSSKDEKYRVALVGNNLMDENFASNAGRAWAGQSYNINRDGERYFGVVLRANF